MSIFCNCKEIWPTISRIKRIGAVRMEVSIPAFAPTYVEITHYPTGVRAVVRHPVTKRAIKQAKEEFRKKLSKFNKETK